MKERHSDSSDKALRDYLKNNADGQLGTVSICTESLKALAAKGLAPNSEDMLPSISNYLTETIDEIGAHAASLAKERFDLNISLPDKATVYSRVASVIEKETYAESASLETLSNNLKSLHQRHTLAIVLLDVSKLGGDYETLIQPYLNEGYFGNFWLAACPIDEDACLDLMGFQNAKTIIDEHPVTLMHGLENWHDGLTDITRLVRHWHAVKDLYENRLIVLPYFNPQNKIVLQLLREIRNLTIYLINLPIECEQAAVDPINWNEHFAEYPDIIKTQAGSLSNAVFDHVVDVISATLNRKQTRALKHIPKSDIRQMKEDLSSKLLQKKRGWSVDKQVEETRKQLLSLVLKSTTPEYKARLNPNAAQFYKTYLEESFRYFSLPKRALNVVSANLLRSLPKQNGQKRKK
ncbi:MAG TPA: hypothetical protein DD827_00360 [Gammaproteobacteria bacterium]|nr:hypothetical protein [Gammaproteobacteria bacterium]